MKIAIHQPNFLPYIGYFHKMAAVDQFVLYDDTQYEKQAFTNRNRIKTSIGVRWVTVPVLIKGRSNQRILEAEIADEGNWRGKILNPIAESYRKTPYFKTYYELLGEIISQKYDKLVDLNIALIEWVRGIVDIGTPVIRSSTLSRVKGGGPDGNLSICQALEADTYYSGTGGAQYQDQTLYERAGIQLEMSQFQHPTYPQPWGAFEPRLSIIDLLFNVGPDSQGMICG